MSARCTPGAAVCGAMPAIRDSQGREWVPTLPADLRAGDTIPFGTGTATITGVSWDGETWDVRVGSPAPRTYVEAFSPVLVLRGEQ